MQSVKDRALRTGSISSTSRHDGGWCAQHVVRTASTAASSASSARCRSRRDASNVASKSFGVAAAAARDADSTACSSPSSSTLGGTAASTRDILLASSTSVSSSVSLTDASFARSTSVSSKAFKSRSLADARLATSKMACWESARKSLQHPHIAPTPHTPHHTAYLRCFRVGCLLQVAHQSVLHTAIVGVKHVS